MKVEKREEYIITVSDEEKRLIERILNLAPSCLEKALDREYSSSEIMKITKHGSKGSMWHKLRYCGEANDE